MELVYSDPTPRATATRSVPGQRPVPAPRICRRSRSDFPPQIPEPFTRVERVLQALDPDDTAGAHGLGFFRRGANCLGVDPDLFFPGQGARRRVERTIPTDLPPLAAVPAPTSTDPEGTSYAD